MLLKDETQQEQEVLHELDIHSYDYYVVFFSGGKDSLASLFWLIEQGVPRERIELWHHDVDGMAESFMDWPVTDDYCRKVAQTLGVRYYVSYKEGGFKREMERKDAPTAPIHYQDENWEWHKVGGNGKPNTRLKFPQISPDLSVRWCSAYLKIDVGASALRNQSRFKGARTLTVSGERAEESANRAKYKMVEPDKADNRQGKRVQRHIDRIRPIKNWDKWEVWNKIREYGINPHPAYWLGLGRVSCMTCIFGSASQFATVQDLDPARFQELADKEKEYGVTMKRDTDLVSLAQSGEVLTAAKQYTKSRKTALSKEFNEPVILDNWEFPPGVDGEDCGPV